MKPSMTRTIALSATHSLEYALRVNRRAKRMSITVYRDGKVAVTLPRATHERFADGFVAQKAGWIISRLERVRTAPKQYFPGGTGEEYRAHKRAARTLVAERLTHFNQFYGAKFISISIRNQKSRWGSCAKNGKLNFNWKIALLPPEMADYIVVHELCHLLEFNHSGKFWDLVAKTVPNHHAIRRALRKG